MEKVEVYAVLSLLGSIKSRYSGKSNIFHYILIEDGKNQI